MKIREQFQTLHAALDTWARERGGLCEIASDPFHLLALLQHKPGGIRAAILFAGEIKRGDFEETGAVDRNFSVILSRGRALTAEPSDSLMKESASGGAPLFDLVEQARDIVRAIQFEDTGAVPLEQLTTEVTPNYLGAEVFAVDGKPLDAYQLNFQIGTQLPAA